MTDADIIKALECCIDCNCKECPCFKTVGGQKRCTEIDEEEILDLINRQKAEIERLKDRLSIQSNRIEEKNKSYATLEAENEKLKKEWGEFFEKVKIALTTL